MSHGSIAELETLLLIAGRVGTAPADRLQPHLTLAERVGQMLTKQIMALRARPPEDQGALGQRHPRPETRDPKPEVP